MEIKYLIKGRMSVDNDWYVCKAGIQEKELQNFIAYYKLTWRYVRVESYR